MQIFKLLLVILLSSYLSAEDGIYSQIPAGKTLVITPKPNQAFSIKRSSNTPKGVGLYDIVIKNGNDILFEDRNLQDDTYFIFNEFVDPDDRLEAIVKRGTFDYKIVSTKALPQNVKEVLDEELLNPKTKKQNVTPKKEKIEQKEIVKEKKEIKSINEQNLSAQNGDLTKRVVEDETKPPTDYLKTIGSFFSSILSELANLFPSFDEPETKESKEESKNKDNKTKESKVEIDSLNLEQKESNFGVSSTKVGVHDIKFEVDQIAKEIPKFDFKQADTKPLKEKESKNSKQEVNVAINNTQISTNVSLESKEASNIDSKTANNINQKTPQQESQQEEIKQKDDQLESKPKVEPIIQDNQKSGEKKIVITKIIDSKKDEDKEIESLSDRVLGTRHKQPQDATLKVIATSNDKPVAAWVEVYRSGTKDRVKTFYTSATRIAKKVTLPSGNYTIKTTYRKASMKQQKIFKNIDLAEGESITKHVKFRSGTLRVVTKRGSQAIRAKIEIYKYRSKRLYTYAFTSKISGEINIILPEGKYDIIIKDFKATKRIRGLNIRGGKTRRVNVSF